VVDERKPQVVALIVDFLLQAENLFRLSTQPPWPPRRVRRDTVAGRLDDTTMLLVDF
jgi:hypothetical protein